MSSAILHLCLPESPLTTASSTQWEMRVTQAPLCLSEACTAEIYVVNESHPMDVRRRQICTAPSYEHRRRTGSMTMRLTSVKAARRGADSVTVVQHAPSKSKVQARESLVWHRSGTSLRQAI